jgi:hypothetical protein
MHSTFSAAAAALLAVTSPEPGVGGDSPAAASAAPLQVASTAGYRLPRVPKVPKVPKVMPVPQPKWP